MKKFIIAMAFLMTAASAFADAPATLSMCLNINGTEASQSGTVLGSAQCNVTQTMGAMSYTSVWSCSFNGNPVQTLNTVGLVGYPNADGSTTIFYDIFPQEDLGSYLLTGLNTPAQFGGTLEIIVDANGVHPVSSNVDLLTGTYDHEFNYVNVQSITEGSCSSNS